MPGPDPVLSALIQTMKRSHVPHAIFDLHDGSLIAVNNALERLLKEHQITSSHGLLRDYPEVVDRITTCRQGAVREPLVFDHDPSGLRVEVSPVLTASDTVCGVQVFVTQLETVRSSTRHSVLERRFQKSLESFPQNVWMCSTQGEMFWINHTANRFSHNQALVHDATNTYWISKIHPDDLPAANSAFAKAMMDGLVRPFRYRVRDNEGKYHWFLSNYAPVHCDESGEVAHWIGTGVNIQSFVDAENALNAEIELLRSDHAKDKLRLREANQLLATTQKMELVSNLAGGVAHDLNNLLFIMSLNADLLFKRLSDDALKESANNVRVNIKKAARLASQLMGFSGRKPQNAAAVDPKALLSEIEDLLEKAVGAEACFSVRVDEDVRPVLVDKMYLENSLINLAINARDAVDGIGTIMLSVVNQTMPHGNVERDYVVFRMHDDGAGMTPQVQQRIFEPFFTTKAAGKGTGLGLLMVKNFVESSGGYLRVDSALGVGTTIALYLPASTDEVEETPPPTEVGAQGGGESLLIIDDDAGVRNALAHALYAVGFQTITTACNSEYAIEFLARGVKADVIISDIKMPGTLSISGFLRKLEQMQIDTPVIFATGYSQDLVVAQGLFEGKYPVMFKPFTLEALTCKIRETIAAQQRVPSH